MGERTKSYVTVANRRLEITVKDDEKGLPLLKNTLEIERVEQEDLPHCNSIGRVFDCVLFLQGIASPPQWYRDLSYM